MPPRVVEIDTATTYDLRRRVLRDGTATDVVELAGDDADDTVHLGIDVDGRIVATSTWMRRAFPAEPDRGACQLRGMACDPDVRRGGLGSLLLRAGVDRARRSDVEVVWANARRGAYDFYLGHGFNFVGDEFVEPETGIVHRRIVLLLDSVH